MHASAQSSSKEFTKMNRSRIIKNLFGSQKLVAFPLQGWYIFLYLLDPRNQLHGVSLQKPFQLFNFSILSIKVWTWKDYVSVHHRLFSRIREAKVKTVKNVMVVFWYNAYIRRVKLLKLLIEAMVNHSEIVIGFCE